MATQGWQAKRMNRRRSLGWRGKKTRKKKMQREGRTHLGKEVRHRRQ